MGYLHSCQPRDIVLPSRSTRAERDESSLSFARRESTITVEGRTLDWKESSDAYK
jgi:hypothetical protein